MRDVIVTKTNVKKEKKVVVSTFFTNYILTPLTGGIIGYIAFLSVIIISKYAGYIIGSYKLFNLDKQDFLLPILGFAFVFIIKLWEKTSLGIKR